VLQKNSSVSHVYSSHVAFAETTQTADTRDSHKQSTVSVMLLRGSSMCSGPSLSARNLS
jgi:hypothetical protein